MVLAKMNPNLLSSAVFSIFLAIYVSGDIPCAARNENFVSVVCVCNSTYCDQISKIKKQPPGSYILYSTSIGGLRFRKTKGKLSDYNAPINKTNAMRSNFLAFFDTPKITTDTQLKVHRKKRYQRIKGFGGSFTDAAAINYFKLSEKTREKIVMSYYSEEGIEYNMGRVPIAGSDFSAKPYAYNMLPENDKKLSNYSLTEEDLKLKIPFIKAATKVATDKLNLIAVAWSPPVWMKNNKRITGVSHLLPEYYQTWADYHLKFLEEYDKFNISFWCISTGNEPVNGLTEVIKFNSLGWNPIDQGRWISQNFGPTIRNSKYKKLKILTIDDQRYMIPFWANAMVLTGRAMDYVDGFGIHWYMNKFIPSVFADVTQKMFREKFILGTEACLGNNEQFTIENGAWDRAERFALNIIDDLNHWYVGWLDWNLILDEEGGPNWSKNFADASMVANPDRDEFIKQPVFYIIGHFSKFVPRGSVRIDTNLVSGSHIDNVAFLRPDGGVAVILYNRHKRTRRLIIKEKGRGKLLLYIPSQSMHTLVYW